MIVGSSARIDEPSSCCILTGPRRGYGRTVRLHVLYRTHPGSNGKSRPSWYDRRTLLTGAALAGWFTLLFLSVALWWALGEAMGRGWAAVVVALLWAVVAAVLAVLGRSQLQKVEGLPQTVETAKKVPDALKGNEDHA